MHVCMCVCGHTGESIVEPIFISESLSIYFILPPLGSSQTFLRIQDLKTPQMPEFVDNSEIGNEPRKCLEIKKEI